LKAGKRVYAVIDGVGVATGDADAARERAGAAADVVIDAEPDVGHAGAASALASVVKACVALYREDGPQFWPHDPAGGPRRAAVAAAGTDGNRVHVVLAEHESADLGRVYDGEGPAKKPPAGPAMTVPVGRLPFQVGA